MVILKLRLQFLSISSYLFAMKFNIMNDILVSPEDIALRQQRFITKVYGWMALALAISAASAYYTLTTPALLGVIFSSKAVFFGLFIAQILLVTFIARRINTLSSSMATALFIIYAITTGVVLSSIFLIYTTSSIMSTFLLAGGMFTAMSLYGWYTGNDLTKMKSLLVMGFIGVFIASIVNFWLDSSMLSYVIGYVGVAVFIGLIAYDTQKLKDLSITISDDATVQKRTAIFGALNLYIDFLNLFVSLLRIFGGRR